MKKSSAIILANVILASLISGCGETTGEVKPVNTKNANASVSAKEGNVVKYKDGTYEARYDDGTEGFYCNAKVTLKNNKITNVEWNIYDSTNMLFDDKYEYVYDSALYKKQCRDNLKGAKDFVPTLIEKQDIKKVDAISGATWANILFKGAVGMALDKAK